MKYWLIFNIFNINLRWCWILHIKRTVSDWDDQRSCSLYLCGGSHCWLEDSLLVTVSGCGSKLKNASSKLTLWNGRCCCPWISIMLSDYDWYLFKYNYTLFLVSLASPFYSLSLKLLCSCSYLSEDLSLLSF